MYERTCISESPEFSLIQFNERLAFDQLSAAVKICLKSAGKTESKNERRMNTLKFTRIIERAKEKSRGNLNYFTLDSKSEIIFVYFLPGRKSFFFLS